MGFKLLGMQYSSLNGPQQTQLQTPRIRGPFVIGISAQVPILPIKTNLDMWIDVSDPNFITKSGTAISALLDKSGNGRTWTGTGTYVNPYINGLSAMTMTTSNTLAYTGKNWAGTNCTVFFVAGATGAAGRILNANANWLLGYYQGKHPSIYGGSTGPTGADNIADTILHTWWASYTSGNVCTFVEDGTTIVNNAGTYTGPNNITVNTGTFAEPSNCAVCELLIYSAVLSVTDATTIATYLKSKWGTP